MHYLVGDLGHLFVITSFITALISSFAYLKASTILDLEEARRLALERNDQLLHACAIRFGNMCYAFCNYLSALF